MPRRSKRIRTALALVFLFSLALLVGIASIVPARDARAQAAGCQIVLGFATLRNMIQAHEGRDVVGACQEDVRYDGQGNAHQRTVGGTLLWERATNWTGFTDGARTWLNGPQGLQVRANGERLSWEAPAQPVAAGQPAYFFVMQASAGALDPVAGATDRFTLILQAPSPVVVAFADRPQRGVQHHTLAEFVGSWERFGFVQDPPNAAIVLSHAADHEDTLVVELREPAWDAATQTLRFAAQVLREGASAGLAFYGERADEDIPQAFQHVTLLIDSAAASIGAPQLDLIQVAAGQTFEVPLRDIGASTGYVWSLTNAGDPAIVEHVETKRVAPAQPIPGAPGQIVFAFKALARGETKLTFELRRPWEHAQPPAEIKVYQIVVR